MELLTMFAASVGCVGGVHLLSKAVGRMGKGKFYSGDQQPKKDDWYCFFKPSVFLGEELALDGTVKTQQQVITGAERREQMRRQQADRPRLQV